jgi:hypothetical protein
MRLVSEVESARRVRGASEPWRRVRLRVRVTRSGTPGRKLPTSLKGRRLTVVRTTTTPASYAPGTVVNLSEAETAPLLSEHAEVEDAVLVGPALRAVVDAGFGGLLTDVALPGAASGTLARSPLRLGCREGDRADQGGALWCIQGRKDLWKAGFRRLRSASDRMVLRQKTGKDAKHVVRTLTVDRSAPLLVDRLEVHPAKKKAGKKSGRPDLVQTRLDVGVRPGCGANVLLPEHDRLVRWPYSVNPARAWVEWPGSQEIHFRPAGGFAAAVGEEGTHVLLFSPKDVDWMITDSRRDHPAMTIHFARRRPAAVFAAAHVIGHEIAFADNRGFALLARNAGVAHVVAYRRGARAATGVATIDDGGRAREFMLERREIDGVGAVYVGHLPLAGEVVGETVVRLSGEVIRIGGRP